ncbi:MAG: hypothetical protein WC977_14645 [Anaerovoracaceae bacterium]|jgi:hypothetical protein
MATKKHDKFGMLFGPSINDEPAPSPEAFKQGREILDKLEELDGTKAKREAKKQENKPAKPKKSGPIADPRTWAIFFRKED